jgi:hypothetical protein
MGEVWDRADEKVDAAFEDSFAGFDLVILVNAVVACRAVGGAGTDQFGFFQRHVTGNAKFHVVL